MGERNKFLRCSVQRSADRPNSIAGSYGPSALLGTGGQVMEARS
ncbi:MAG: hypothetical protein WBL85_10880 [Sedimentisphaerales bacterium]